MDAQGRHEFRFGKPCFGCFWHSEGFSGTPDGQFDQFSEKLDTHGEKKSASECSKAAHLQFCYKNARDMQYSTWLQSRRDAGERGSRCEFCSSKVAKKVTKRGK